MASRGDGGGDPVRLVTVRPGGGAPLMALMGVVLLVVVVVVTPRAGVVSAEWDGGDPVVVQITQVANDDVELTEFGGGRSWTYSVDAVRQVAEPDLGTSISGRLVGECRCELMLRPVTGLPGWLPLLPLVFLGSAVPGLLARWRWRRLGETLAAPPRPATVEPVWLRRPVGPPVWGVRAATEGRTLLLELVGTPPHWFPGAGVPVTIRGPHPANGLTVLESPDGTAVASSAPLSEAAGRSRVARWSARAASAAGMVGPAPEAAIAVGGDHHQRVSVTSAAAVGQPAGTLELDPARVSWAPLLVMLAGYSGWLVLVILVRPSLAAILALYLAVFVAVRVARTVASRRLARTPPLALWDDRPAAIEASRALFPMGYVPSRGATAAHPPANGPVG